MAQAIPIDETFLRQTLVDLVRIDSSNPSLTPGAPGEGALAAQIAETLAALRLEVAVHELGDKRVNVVGVRRGAGSGPSLMLNGHMDTVGTQGMDEPFSAAIRDGKLYGRGSQDMKASLAAMISVARTLNEQQIQLAGDLILTFVADEEYASLGTEDIVRRYRADAAIVTEPTDLAICRAHRGFIWYEVETHGRAAHGSRFREGVDAIMYMGRFLAELDQLEQELRARTPHELAGPPSLHTSRIQGGTELSVYPAHCRLELERRTVPGESTAQVTAELQALIDRLAATDPLFHATVQSFFERAPYAVPADAPIVLALEKAAQARLGETPPHMGATFWTDAALLAEAGMDTVLIGPVGAGLHSAEEWVELRSTYDLAAILTATAIDYCGRA